MGTSSLASIGGLDGPAAASSSSLRMFSSPVDSTRWRSASKRDSESYTSPIDSHHTVNNRNQ